MNHGKRQRLRMWAGLASAALVAGAMTAVAVAPAQADDFDQGNIDPVVSAVTAGFAMQPAANGTSATYQIDATITDGNTLLDLNTVTLCLYNTAGGTSDCSSTDSQNTMKMVWTRADDAFVLTSGGSTYWADQTSLSDYTATNTAMDLNFKFKVGEAALQGDWTAKVTALDTSAGTHTVTDATHSVAYYGSVDTNRAGQSYGELAKDGSANAQNISHGTLQVNGATDISYAVANLTDGTTTMTNMGGLVTAAPDVTKFALDCLGGSATYDNTGAARIAAGATEVHSNILTGGAVEDGNTTNVASCRLATGGQVPAQTYTGALTVTVAAQA
ncbi:MAG: hypothetical protein U0990_02930 [Candidatus Nanopelagicales bacterium]|nr:hypothetical protein [Candidatus Nanopelagicales bacterium]MDZ4249026.1 hypothetical protein [Candidatus Nanopelagicales bacterium]